MTPLQLDELARKALMPNAASRSQSVAGETPATQDRLWQQAMHQAQQQGFAGWFAQAEMPAPDSGDSKATAPQSAGLGRPMDPLQRVWTPNPSEQRASHILSAALPVSPSSPDSDPSALASTSAASVDTRAVDVPADAKGSERAVGDRPLVAPGPTLAVGFGRALVSAFATPGIAVSAGPSSGHFADQSPAGTPQASPPRATLLRSIGTLPNEEADAEQIDAHQPLPTATSTPMPSLPARPSDPLRVHAEWSAEGVRIWLGAEADALDAAHALAGRLHEWLGQRGERLLSFVCNGRVWPVPRQRLDSSQSDANGSQSLPVVNSSSSQEAS